SRVPSCNRNLADGAWELPSGSGPRRRRRSEASRVSGDPGPPGAHPYAGGADRRAVPGAAVLPVALEARTISADQIIVGIDVGTTKVCTLIADMASGSPEILGVGIAPSQGLRKGVVVDVQAAVGAIESSLRRAEQQSGYKAMSALVGIAGAHVLSTNS